MECEMAWKTLLSASLTLMAAVPEVQGQTVQELPPLAVPSPAGAVPPVPNPVPGNGQPDPSALYPPLRPGEVSPPDACPGVCPPCEARCENFWTRPALTGDWLGLRPRLQESGVTFQGNLTQFGFGQGGGINRPLPPALTALGFGQGGTFEYTGRGDYAFIFDLEKFGGMPKGTLLVRAQQWFGHYGNVSLNTGAFPPAIFPASIPPVPNDQGVPYVTDFLLTQPLSKKWVVFMGKKNVLGAADQDDFAGGNGTNQFMNQAFVANPAFLLAMPYTSFTAGVVSPRDWGSVSAFVYDPQDRTKNFFALDSLFSQGIIVGTEVKLKTNFFSLPGEQHVGGLWKHLELTDLRFNEPPPGVYPEPVVPGFPTLGDSYTIYYGFDQYLRVYSEDTKRGWGLFGRASISDANPTPIRYFLSLGVGGYSPIRYRQGDTFGVGWYYTGTSTEFGPLPRALFGPRPGWGLELFYNVQITPWMNLTPDFQIVKPEAGAIARTAYIGGIRLNLKF
jgi:porin